MFPNYKGQNENAFCSSYHCSLRFIVDSTNWMNFVCFQSKHLHMSESSISSQNPFFLSFDIHKSLQSASRSCFVSPIQFEPIKKTVLLRIGRKVRLLNLMHTCSNVEHHHQDYNEHAKFHFFQIFLFQFWHTQFASSTPIIYSQPDRERPTLMFVFFFKLLKLIYAKYLVFTKWNSVQK